MQECVRQGHNVDAGKSSSERVGDAMVWRLGWAWCQLALVRNERSGDHVAWELKSRGLSLCECWPLRALGVGGRMDGVKAQLCNLDTQPLRREAEHSHRAKKSQPSSRGSDLRAAATSSQDLRREKSQQIQIVFSSTWPRLEKFNIIFPSRVDCLLLLPSPQIGRASCRERVS